jgi:hypothetical protein
MNEDALIELGQSATGISIGGRRISIGGRNSVAISSLNRILERTTGVPADDSETRYTTLYYSYGDGTSSGKFFYIRRGGVYENGVPYDLVYWGSMNDRFFIFPTPLAQNYRLFSLPQAVQA